MSIIVGWFIIQTRDAHARLLTDLVKARVDAEDWAVKAFERQAEIDRLNAVIHVQQTQLATMRSAIRDADKLLGLRND